MTLLELLDQIKANTGNENVRWGSKNGELIIYTGFDATKFAVGGHLVPIPFDYGRD